MSLENEKIIRKAYQFAEDKDVPGWVAAFTEVGGAVCGELGLGVWPKP